MTNKEIAATNPTFRKACELAGIPATARQASKWERQTGLARQFRSAVLTELQREAGRKAVAR